MSSPCDQGPQTQGLIFLRGSALRARLLACLDLPYLPSSPCSPSFAFPDAKGLSNPGEVEVLREKVYASLETYCKQKYPEQQGR